MQRWDTTTNTAIEDLKVDTFIQEILDVCRKHKMVISHEDGNGAFMILTEASTLDEQLCFNWLENAHLAKELK